MAQQNTQAKNGFYLVGVAAIALSAWFLFNNLRSVFNTPGHEQYFWETFFSTQGDSDLSSFMFVLSVWGPFVLIPLAIVMFALGVPYQKRLKAKQQEADAQLAAGYAAGGVQQPGQHTEPTGYGEAPGHHSATNAAADPGQYGEGVPQEHRDPQAYGDAQMPQYGDPTDPNQR